MKRLMVAAAVLALAGCGLKYAGSRIVVGEQTALPELSDTTDSVTLRMFESVKGAKVWTAKDSLVKAAYTNIYTNSYFGIVDTVGQMILNVVVEPLDMGGTNAVEKASVE